jgi:TolA-binding protein
MKWERAVGHNVAGFTSKGEAFFRAVGGLAGFIACLCSPVLAVTASGAEATDGDLGAFRRQINKIQYEESAEKRRVDQDERLIRQLEAEIEQLQTQHALLTHKANALTVTSEKLKADTAQLQDSQKQLTAGIGDEQFGSAMSRWLGSHQFTWNGAVAGSFIYDRANNTNTFALTFEPLVIYRLND